MTQWTVPLPPRPPDRPIRAGKVWAGIGLAIAAHVVSIVITVALAFAVTASQALAITLWVGLAGQLAVFVGCLAFGIIWIAKYDRGIGVGLLIGWSVGVIVLPVVGFGLCVWALSQNGAGFG
jgi:hypothetical protein